MSQIEHFNYINNLLPRVSEQTAPELGHKDRRGQFVDPSKQEALLQQLGKFFSCFFSISYTVYEHFVRAR